MKVGKYEWQFAPNGAFWAASGIVVYLCISNHTIVPLLVWLGILAASIPLSIWASKKLARMESKHKSSMLRDHGNDPEVQMRFGDCKDMEEAFHKAAQWQPHEQ